MVEHQTTNQTGISFNTSLSLLLKITDIQMSLNNPSASLCIFYTMFQVLSGRSVVLPRCICPIFKK